MHSPCRSGPTLHNVHHWDTALHVASKRLPARPHSTSPGLPITHHKRATLTWSNAPRSSRRHSIHAGKLAPGELAAAQRSMPIPVPNCPGIYHCGWHDAKSFAAASYLLVRPGGNVLVDSPRYGPVLAQQIEKLGGVKYMFLTHRWGPGGKGAVLGRREAVSVMQHAVAGVAWRCASACTVHIM